jgi:integrase
VHPDTPCVPGLSRSQAHKAYVRARTAAGVAGYTLRDARHSVAIRMRRAGESFEAIARQLGNTVAQVHATYARFQPGDAPEAATTTTTDCTTRDVRAG